MVDCRLEVVYLQRYFQAFDIDSIYFTNYLYIYTTSKLPELEAPSL